jgi:hypothetical protein
MKQIALVPSGNMIFMYEHYTIDQPRLYLTRITRGHALNALLYNKPGSERLKKAGVLPLGIKQDMSVPF